MNNNYSLNHIVPIGSLIIIFLVQHISLTANSLKFDKKQTGAQNSWVIGEGFDFATRVLHDPWDMAEFSDISQWFNHGGADNYLVDFQVKDGVFSAKTAGGLSYFFTLYGGYGPAINTGKIGRIYSIPTDTYACFYMAMKAQTEDIDYFQFNWGDELMPPSVSGLTGAQIRNGDWKLYEIDLRTWPNQVGTEWIEREQWSSFRITPSLKAGTSFSVDWVRLTDCKPVVVTLEGLPQGKYSLWATYGQSSRKILMVYEFSPNLTGTYQWDVQGLQPGEYDFIVETPDKRLVRSGHVTIKPTPIVHFNRPSPTSGQDYATISGNSWDMGGEADLTRVSCTNHAIIEGVLTLDTLPPHQVPGGCIGSGAGEVDAKVLLNTPSRVSLNKYRYLSFRHRIDGAWSLPEQGMITRWIWGVDRPGVDCDFVSREIALDVGWSTYMVDLFDDWNGMPIEAAPSDCSKVHWKDERGYVYSFRFDPNENITSSTFHQEVDWIRLTRVDQVKRGVIFPVKVLLNIPQESLKSITFYYTSNLNEPTQMLAESSQINQVVAQQTAFHVYVPLNLTGGYDPFVAGLPADLIYSWDTSNVRPGEYYLCARTNDGYSQNVNCSEAPVQVIAP